MKDSKENLSSQGMLDHIKPCWYWDKKDLAHTPSQSEGLDPGTEARYRREGARFIFDVGTRLGLYPSITFKLWQKNEELSKLPLFEAVKNQIL